MKIPFYKTLETKKTQKNKLIGLFGIYEESNCNVFKGYSVKFKTRNISLKRFQKGFYEEYDELDKNYGNTVWDFISKELAIKKFEGL